MENGRRLCWVRCRAATRSQLCRSTNSAHYDLAVQTQLKLGDVLANAITHGVGAILAAVGAVYLVSASARGTV